MAAFESIGYWSEVKLEIERKYAAAYSTILAAQPGLYHVYVDAFAGAGMHLVADHGRHGRRQSPQRLARPAAIPRVPLD
jgi:hypothetical protein